MRAGIADDQRVVGHVPGDDRARADECVAPIVVAAHDRAVGAEAGAAPDHVCRYSCLRDTWLRGLMTLVNTIDGPQNTSSSSMTPV